MFKYLFVLALVLIGSQALQGVVQLTDSNFAQQVYSNPEQPTFWIVLFAADWCGHCQRLKPEFTKLSAQLAEHGVKLGHVTDKNPSLVDQFVVDHNTHMVSYPKLKVFLGEELLGDVPPGLRTAQDIESWFVKQYGLGEAEL